MVQQFEFALQYRRRGFHLITEEVISKIEKLPEKGLLHVHILHTSAAITINENADPSVLVDFESYMNHIVPENMPFITHDMEGSDDMPAHIKASMMGSSVTIPISNGSLRLGTWQGIYLCEFRDHPHRRNLFVTIIS